MPLDSFKIKQGEAKTYPPLPEDVYQVELFDISAREVDDNYNKGKKQTVLSFQFTILEDCEYRARNIWRDFVPVELYISKKGKNVLYQIIEAIICRELREDEIATMDSEFLNKMIGYQCRITVKTREKEGSKKSFIDSFLPKKMTLPKLTDEEREKCKVKPREDSAPVTDSSLASTSVQTAPDDDIPTINLDEDEPADTMTEITSDLKEDDKEIKIEDVPF